MRADAPADLLQHQDELDEKRSVAYKAFTYTTRKAAETRTAIGKLDSTKEKARIATLEPDLRMLDQQVEDLRAALQTYSAEQQDLDAMIRRASPRLASLRYPQPLDLKGAQAALDGGTLLLAYVVDEATTYLFAVTKNNVRLFKLPLGRQRLAEKVRTFRAIVAKVLLGDPAENGRQLYDELVRPAQDLADRAQRVLICPDGPLQVMPFAALVSRRGPQPGYFIDDHPLHMISSMTVYAETRMRVTDALRSTLVDARSVPLLAFGDPIYTKEQAGVASGIQSDVLAKGRDVRRCGVFVLPAARHEHGSAATNTRRSPDDRPPVRSGGARQVGSRSHRPPPRGSRSDAIILHFASHGWMDETMGLNSGLALSQPAAIGRKTLG